MRAIAIPLLAGAMLLPGMAIAADPVKQDRADPAPDSAAITARNAAILTIDQDLLYRESAWGQRSDAELSARSRALSEENDRIVDQLEAEDDALTQLRKTLPADEFRRRADAFDARVQKTRQEREAASRALLEAAENDRSAFFNAALPIFTKVMQEREAVAVLDHHMVFLASRAIDITGAMIARVDEEIGAGPDLPAGHEPASARESDGGPDDGDSADAPAVDVIGPGAGITAPQGADASGAGPLAGPDAETGPDAEQGIGDPEQGR